MDCLPSLVEPGKSLDIQSGLSEIYTRLYTTLLKSFIYDDVAFEKIATELTLGTILNEHDPPNFRCDGDENVSVTERADESADSIFREDEILVYEMPERRQLSPAATKRLRDEINATLQTIAELFHANSTQDLGGSCPPPLSSLPDDLLRQVSDIDSMQLELDTLSLRLTKLVGKTQMAREEFDRELEHLICTTFPAFKASRNASIDLLSATFEATLQRLNSIRESARQAFYNHQVEGDARNTKKTVSRAISIAYQALAEEEGALRTETQDLDRQIQEYESLLRLVDGSSGGYRQIVSDWVKTKRETDECLKDLRRLGWSGD